MLRPGNVHSADRWKEMLEPIVARYGRRKSANTFGVMQPSPSQRFMILGGEGLFHAIRLPANRFKKRSNTC